MKIGRILFAGALAALPASAAWAAPAGEALFQQRCAICHAVDPGPTKMGPPLRGVVGRKAAAVPGYAYSPAMKKAGITWTRAELDRFLKTPAQTVRGGKMMVATPSAEDRAAIVAYLASLKPLKR